MADCYFAGKSHTTRFYCGKHVQDYQRGLERARATACRRAAGPENHHADTQKWKPKGENKMLEMQQSLNGGAWPGAGLIFAPKCGIQLT